LNTGRRRLGCAVALTALALTAACSGGDTAAPAAASSPSANAPASASSGWRLVALGDSDADGSGDPTGGGWVARYAELVQDRTGRPVEVAQHAVEGLTSDELLARLQSDAILRTDVGRADIVVLGAGGADLNAGDDAWVAGSCTAEACYRDGLAAFGRNIEAVAALVARLRGEKPTLLRAVTVPNGLTGAEDVIPDFLRPVATRIGVFQATALRRSTCAAMRSHGGECIDVLTVFNGADGTRDAYRVGLMNHDECCYPSGEGQQRMAELLVATGLEPQPLR
jgi:lysophospholipase L1-like esterase